MQFPNSSSRMRVLAIAQTLFTPIFCILFAIGSAIMSLVWVFLDFFADRAVIDLYAWLPLIALVVVMALLMTEKWLTAIVAILLVLVSLVGLYYLLFLIGLLVWLPTRIIGASGLILLLLLDGAVSWITYRVRQMRGEKRQNVQLKRRLLIRLPKTALAVVLGGLFIKLYFWDDPSKRWLLSDLFPYQDGGQKLTLAPPLSNMLQDASHLTSTLVSEIRSPKSTAEVIQAVSDARSTQRKLSLSGIRHSMGGQALGTNTLHLDMTHMDQIVYNSVDQTVTVGPGATWMQIQAVLSRHGRAVRVMQDSNIFTVGGSLSVNAHGKDPLYGSLIESVNVLKLVTADGNEIQCDRTQQNDLFSAVIGGYGTLGIITEATLKTTENSSYAYSLIPTQTQGALEMMETLVKNPANRLLEIHLSVDSGRFLTESLIYVFSEDKSLSPLPDDLQGENSIWLRKVIFQASRISNAGKILRWDLEKLLTPLVDPKKVSRNTAMSVPVRFLQNPDPQTTDLLQEYFVPIEQGYAFLENYKRLLNKYGVNLLNVTIRRVSQDTSALVSYAQTAMYGFVVYYKVAQSTTDIQRIQSFTRELVEYLLTIKARYYLCYGSYYTQSQLASMYPEIRTLFTLKKHYDPGGMFTNQWYETYRGILE